MKTNIMDFALRIDTDQFKHAAQADLEETVSGNVTLYLYLPETVCVGPDKPERTTQADQGRYIT